MTRAPEKRSNLIGGLGTGGKAAALGLTAVLLQVPTRSWADPEDLCAKVRNDDRIRAYDPALRPGFVRAFKKLFPKATGGQSDAMLRAQGVFRCMDGRFVVCFTGANLPCTKIDRRRENNGADAYCRANPKAGNVPLAAIGHASEFSWRCRDGKAEISGTAWMLDARGFAKDLWAPMDLD